MSDVYHRIEGGETPLGLHVEQLLLEELSIEELSIEPQQVSVDMVEPSLSSEPRDHLGSQRISIFSRLAPPSVEPALAAPGTVPDSSDCLSTLDSPSSSGCQSELAEALLASSALTASDAACLALEILNASPQIELSDRASVINHCRHILQLGLDCHARACKTLPFGSVVDALILHKLHRRKRTIAEIKQYCERIMRCCPSWRTRELCHINAEDCEQVISQTFGTPSMQRKAHIILHGLFNFAMRRGWCTYNPITLLSAPRPQERRISALSLRDLSRLLRTALEPKHRPCAPALGFMLWGGVRPTEIERITWSDVHIKDKLIAIAPQHAKSSAHRQATIYPALYTWLRRVCTYTLPQTPIIPRAWDRRWRELRRSAGFEDWQTDILRHTFASYHLKHFRDLATLQIDMGHTSLSILRTRYLALEGITASAAKEFWTTLPYIEQSA